MAFLYSIFLKLLYPTSLTVLLLLASAVWHRRKALSRVLFWAGLAVLLICGNGLIWRGPVRHLERQYLAADPLPKADAILILAGGLRWRLPPRPTIEVGEGGDRMLYGAYLYRQGLSKTVICTGGFAAGTSVRRYAGEPVSQPDGRTAKPTHGRTDLPPAAEEMADFLDLLGLSKDVILTEGGSSNTHQHAVNLKPMFEERGIKTVLLVTSAMHMPRSMGVFGKECPDVEFIPAPTDFRIVDRPLPWYRELVGFIPTPSNLVGFNEMSHEYLGMWYYRVRGWM